MYQQVKLNKLEYATHQNRRREVTPNAAHHTLKRIFKGSAAASELVLYYGGLWGIIR